MMSNFTKGTCVLRILESASVGEYMKGRARQETLGLCNDLHETFAEKCRFPSTDSDFASRRVDEFEEPQDIRDAVRIIDSFWRLRTHQTQTIAPLCGEDCVVL